MESSDGGSGSCCTSVDMEELPGIPLAPIIVALLVSNHRLDIFGTVGNFLAYFIQMLSLAPWHKEYASHQ